MDPITIIKKNTGQAKGTEQITNERFHTLRDIPPTGLPVSNFPDCQQGLGYDVCFY